jgi:hypothetical protein
VTSDAAWLSVNNGSGTLAVGATAEVVISVNNAANELSVGKHAAQLKFENLTTHTGDKQESITLGVGTPRVQIAFNMDAEPGFTAQGDWKHGKPQGLSGDPTSGFTGNNVYGYNLAGAFPANLPETHLTTAAIDCSNLTQTKLRFRRWLCVETANYDHAYVRVSTDGVTWKQLWQNPFAQTTDTSWQLQEFDISEIADGKSTLYVRWTMGTTDSIVQGCGWNVDDVEIWGVKASPKSCTSDADCVDTSFCNGTESCVAGQCGSGTPVSCGDAISCTVDSCDEATKACKHTPNNAICSNGSFCDGTEICTSTGCSNGTPPCTTACDEASDKCVACTKNADCSDGLFCNGTESCVANTCLKGTAPCTGGTCDESSDSCGCVPKCDGRQCGDNGCGGSCGSCATGKSCNTSGQCVSSCDGVATWDQSQWASYGPGTRVIRAGSLYECKDRNWSWIAPDDRDGVLGWTKIGPC